MKRKIFLIALTGLLLCSCENEKQTKNNIVPDIKQETEQTVISVTETFEEKIIEQTETVIVKNENVGYDIFKDAVKAEELYNVEIIDMPETINGNSYYPRGLKDGKIVVALSLEETDYSCSYEYGLFDYKTGNYEQVISSISNGFYKCSFDNYYVLSVRNSSNIDSLQLYDSGTKSFKTIINYTDNFYETGNNVAVDNNNIYFDVVTTPERDNIAVYKYDIEKDDIEKIADHAHHPMTSKGSLWYVNINQEKKINDKAVNVNSGSEVEIEGEIIAEMICFDEKLFAVVNNPGEEKFDSKDIIVELQNKGDNVSVISTRPEEGEIFNSLLSNDFCISWSDITGGDSTPYVYDVLNDKLVYFDGLGDCYYQTYLENGKGMILDNMNYDSTHKLIVFEPKG